MAQTCSRCGQTFQPGALVVFVPHADTPEEICWRCAKAGGAHRFEPGKRRRPLGLRLFWAALCLLAVISVMLAALL